MYEYAGDGLLEVIVSEFAGGFDEEFAGDFALGCCGGLYVVGGDCARDPEFWVLGLNPPLPPLSPL